MRLSVALVAVLLTSSVVDGALISTGPFEWESAQGGNGHWYELVMPEAPGDGVSWTTTKSLAENTVFGGDNGHLVTVTSAGENDFLQDKFKDFLRPNSTGFAGDFAWIGLTDAAQEGNYQWVTGETLSYTNWGPSEPNDLFGEDFVHYWVRNGSLSWNDQKNFQALPDTLYGYIVEFDSATVIPEPTTLAIWSVLGGIGLAAGRRRQKRNRAA